MIVKRIVLDPSRRTLGPAADGCRGLEEACDFKKNYTEKILIPKRRISGTEQNPVESGYKQNVSVSGRRCRIVTQFVW